MGATLGEPDAPLAFQRMDQRIDRGGGEGIAAHQQGVEGQRLAQLLALHEARHLGVDAAPGRELGQLGTRGEHVADLKEGLGAETDVAFFEHRLGIGQEALVAGHVVWLQGTDLLVQPGLVVDVVEAGAVFPAQLVEGADRQELHIVAHLPAAQGEQLFQRRGIGEDGGAGVEGEARLLIDVGTAAGLVAALDEGGGDAGDCRRIARAIPPKPRR